MNFLLLFIAISFSVGTIFLYKFLEKRQNNKKFKKTQILMFVICGIYIATYILRMMTVDVFSIVRVGAGITLFSDAQIVLITLLRFFTQGLILYYMLVAFFNIKNINTTLATFGLFITLANIIFFKQNLMAFEGYNFSFFSYRAIQFAIECTLALIISSILLYKKTLEKDGWKNWQKQLGFGFLCVFFIGLITMHPSTIQNMFTFGADEAEGFNLTHRICLYIIVGGGILLNLIFRNKDIKIKHYTCLVLSMAGISAFFITHSWNIPLTALPLHLCNAALIVATTGPPTLP